MNIRACPFCDGFAKLKSRFSNIGTQFWIVQCGICRAKTANYDTAEEAARAWNRRANDESAGGL